MTKKLTVTEKVNRKPISRACKFCHGKHLQCDPGRPCKNCVKRGLQDSCESIQRKRAKYLVDPVRAESELDGVVETETVGSAPQLVPILASGSNAAQTPAQTNEHSTRPKPSQPTRKVQTKRRNWDSSVTPTSNILPQSQLQPQQFLSNQMFHNGQNTSNNDFMNHISSSKSDMSDLSSIQDSISNLSTPQSQPQSLSQQQHQQQQQYLLQQEQIQSLLPHFQRKSTSNFNFPTTSEIPPPPPAAATTEKFDINKFASKYANQEYLQLSEILDNNFLTPSSPTSTTSGANNIFHNYNYNNPEFRTAFQSDNNIRAAVIIPNNSNNSNDMEIDYDIESDSVMQDPDYTSPLVQRHLIKTPNDVYLANFTSYNYPKAYLALLDYLKERFKKDQLYAIAETMAAYRPRFIAATRSLVEMDLLFAERSFQRSLLEYESMSGFSSSPTIMWRRTGEIVAVSSEFSSLTNYTKPDLLSKRTFIVEIMNDNAALDYFKKFSSLAFSEINAVVIPDCCLVGPDGSEIPCSSTWTVKRDVFDIPMLIVGQFLPVLIVK